MFVGTRDFSRFVQADDHSCGSRAVQALLDWAGVHTPHALLKYRLRTRPEHGTTVSRIVKVLRKAGLHVGHRPQLSFPGLFSALKRGGAVLAHVDGNHWVVVFGVDDTHVFISDPSIIRCIGKRQTRHRFGRRFGRWGLIVTRSGGRRPEAGVRHD